MAYGLSNGFKRSETGGFGTVSGVGGFLSVLESQKNLLAARRKFIEAQGAAAQATVELELATGRPLEALLHPAAEHGTSDSDDQESPERREP